MNWLKRITGWFRPTPEPQILPEPLPVTEPEPEPEIPWNLPPITRRDLRYRLFRLRSGQPLPLPGDWVTYLEYQAAFDGWDNFARTWDLSSKPDWNGRWLAVSRHRSADAEWEATLQRQTRELK